MEKHLKHIEELIVSALAQQDLQHLQSAVFQGKLLRPALCLHMAQAFGITITNDILLLACSLECIHIASLIHDDIIDISPSRRCKATLWTEHGIPQAVLGGDFFLAQSLVFASQTANMHAIQLVSEKTKSVIHGEIMQKKLTSIPICYRHYLRIITLKTASLFEAAVLLFTPPKYSTESKKLGRYIGIAFQILNDIKDYAFLWTKTPPGDDIARRHVTAPLLWMLHHSQKKESLAHCWAHSNDDQLTATMRAEPWPHMLTEASTTLHRITHKAHKVVRSLPLRSSEELRFFIHETLEKPLAILNDVLT